MEKYYFKDSDVCKKKGYLVASLDCSKCNAMESYSLDERYIKCTLLEVIQAPELSKDLTKREHFAFEFAKIFLNNDIKRGVGDKIMGGARGLSNSSVMVADELIKALNKEKEVPQKKEEKEIKKGPGLCYNCGKQRDENEDGSWVCPCPHCGDEIPF